METATEHGRRSLTERRQQLLDAAIEVMSARGIAGATTRAITDAAGVPQGIFHYCYDSKADLLKALLERESERAMAVAWQLDPVTASFSVALARTIRAQLDRVRAEPKHFLVLSELTVLARTDPSLTAIARADRARAAEKVADVLYRWQPDLTEHDRKYWAAVLLAGIDGLTEAWLTDRDDATIDAAARLFAAASTAHIHATRASQKPAAHGL